MESKKVKVGKKPFCFLRMDTLRIDEFDTKAERQKFIKKFIAIGRPLQILTWDDESKKYYVKGFNS